MAEELTRALERRSERGSPRGATAVLAEARLLVADRERLLSWHRGPVIAVATALIALLVVGGVLLASRLLLGDTSPVATVPTTAPPPPPSELRTLEVQAEGVAALAWSPDGTYLATASRAIEGNDGIVRIWDATTGVGVLTFATGDYETTRVTMAYSPDGTHIAIIGGGTGVYDAATGDEVLGWISDGAVAYSPDGTRIAASGAWGWAAVLDATTGEEQLTLPMCPSPFSWVWAVAWSPDGTRLATTCMTEVKVWDATTGDELLTITNSFETTGVFGRVTDVAWSPDGTRIATATRDIADGSAGWIVEVWDTDSGEELTTVTGGTGELWVVAWSPDGTRIATAGHDGTAKIWDADSGDELATLTGHTAEVTDVAWSPDGTRFATASEDGSVKVWELR